MCINSRKKHWKELDLNFEKLTLRKRVRNIKRGRGEKKILSSRK